MNRRHKYMLVAAPTGAFLCYALFTLQSFWGQFFGMMAMTQLWQLIYFCRSYKEDSRIANVLYIILLLDLTSVLMILQRVNAHAFISLGGLVVCALLITLSAMQDTPFGGRYDMPVSFLMLCLFASQVCLFFFLKDGRPLPKIFEDGP